MHGTVEYGGRVVQLRDTHAVRPEHRFTSRLASRRSVWDGLTRGQDVVVTPSRRWGSRGTASGAQLAMRRNGDDVTARRAGASLYPSSHGGAQRGTGEGRGVTVSADANQLRAAAACCRAAAMHPIHGSPACWGGGEGADASCPRAVDRRGRGPEPGQSLGTGRPWWCSNSNGTAVDAARAIHMIAPTGDDMAPLRNSRI